MVPGQWISWKEVLAGSGKKGEAAAPLRSCEKIDDPSLTLAVPKEALVICSVLRNRDRKGPARAILSRLLTVAVL